VKSTSFTPAPVPTLVIGGAHDPVFTLDLLRDRVVSPIPGARLELLEANHEIPSELPREFAALIDSFVAEVADPGRLMLDTSSS
jgi:pimeloyl-ACP methyl ester carboxylesterase